MVRVTKINYHRGTLTVHPPPKGKGWIEYAQWDDRLEKFVVLAKDYRPLVDTLVASGTQFIDEAKKFITLELKLKSHLQPYAHQQEALQAWKDAKRTGVVVLPTAGGKTYLALMVMESTPRSTLIVVPTLDLMQQWYGKLLESFPNAEVGLLGGGSKDDASILIATYNSAAIHSETLGNKYGLLIFDECHHLPTDFFRKIAEDAIAPYRLGLSATVDRTDGNHQELNNLIGPIVYTRTPQDLSTYVLAEHRIIQIKVKLSPEEQQRYQKAIKIRNDFLRRSKIHLGSLNGWQDFIRASARSAEGRQAMLAHRESKEIAYGTEGKLKVLTNLIQEHHPKRMIIFTNDNATVYRISQEFLIPAITHETPVKERHQILEKFCAGDYHTLVTSHVLNEGVDVPDACIGVILSGTGSTREYIQRLGRILRKGSQENKLAILYEVVAEDTSEESTSKRRTGEKLQLIDFPPQEDFQSNLRAAEKPGKYDV